MPYSFILSRNSRALSDHSGMWFCNTMLGWELVLRARLLFVSIGAVLLIRVSSGFNKEGNWAIPPFARWIPILRHYITLIPVSALQQDESARCLALFLPHHHSVMVDLAGWSEDFHLLLPLMTLSEASNSHAPCGCSGLEFRGQKTAPFLDSDLTKLQVVCPWMREKILV